MNQGIETFLTITAKVGPQWFAMAISAIKLIGCLILIKKFI
jgi:hypothetical protein